MSFTERIKQVMTSITGTQEQKVEEPQFTDIQQIFLNTPEHIEEGIALADKTIIPDAANVQHITFVGMGGSVHPGFLLKTYLENIDCKKQINLIREDEVARGRFFPASESGADNVFGVRRLVIVRGRIDQLGAVLIMRHIVRGGPLEHIVNFVAKFN